MITNSSQVSLKRDYFPSNPEQAQTLMLTSLIEALLARNRNIGTTSILGANRTTITEYYLGKRLHQSKSGPTDMRPVVRKPLTITDNPFKPEPLTENPTVTELNVIGQGGSWAVIGGTHTQSIIEGRE